MTAAPLSADPAVAAAYREAGWWGDTTIASRVAELAASAPEATAFVTPSGRFSWGEYDAVSTGWATVLARLELDPGARVAVILPDGPAVHAAFVAVEKAGAVIVGIGHRAGGREVRHLLGLTGARVLVTADPGVASDHDLDHVVVVPAAPGVGDGTLVVDGTPVPLPSGPPTRTRSPVGPDDLFLLNSTSGTTGLPKCVMHTQNRWFYFHQLAAEAGGLVPDDVVFGAIPAPFGFGLWTAHFSPTILGCPAVVTDRFDAAQALDLIEHERVTVLCCVSTQFIMLLNAQAEQPRDLSSLRVMFTGGEAVPYERAVEFEEQTGAALLQFYGSNETGALSRTSRADTRDHRLRTAGRVIDDMAVRLFDPETGDDISGSGGPGQPGCRGPATCLGYWGDDEANAQLVRPDGWMLMGDIVDIDDDGYLRVVGRTSDFIIRGGKNVSAPAVEEEVGTHPAVAMVAAVPSPDPVFGERVCVYVVLGAGQTITIEDLVAHLTDRGVSKEWFPERLVVVDDLPRSSGGKVAKGELREDARRRFIGA